ncbi:hypothetical protein [Tabrizicola sp.]|uniref:hypothetical protein n=1 Tax=Tabrizicola sp. TaxID=2005166 RepID=UPI002631D94A|nr:hypothetical protein [Tabrizicola sp.]MDM7932395.1 hypothetical protein [Tabrizicola sp.]
MKRIVLAAALVAASTVGTLAQTAPVALSSSIQSQIMLLVPGADLSNLTNSQYAQLVTFFGDSENLRTRSGAAQQVSVILGVQ